MSDFNSIRETTRSGTVREKIKFNGRWYYRYPEAKQANHRRYYSSHAKWKSTPRLLHRDVWEFYNGPIPDGHHVHHESGDFNDNRPGNLMCLSEAAHWVEHRDERSARSSTEKHLKHLENIRESAKAWHSSPEGREWHRQHARESILGRDLPEQACLICGTMYNPIINRPGMCSDECKKERRNNLQREAWRSRVRPDGGN